MTHSVGGDGSFSPSSPDKELGWEIPGKGEKRGSMSMTELVCCPAM